MTEQELLAKVKKSNRTLIIVGSCIIITLIAAIIIVIAVFKPKKDFDVAQLQQLLEAKNETIKVLQDAQHTITVMHDQTIEIAQQADREDSVIRAQLIRNQANYKIIKQQYETIPEHNNRLRSNIDSLLREIADY